MSSNNKFATIEDTRYCVFAWNVLTQGNLPNQDGAKQLLGRCVDLMTKLCVINKTCVVKVEEFFPRSANLLGLNTNHGERIQVRLRPANNKASLLCFEEVMCTCCHELAHNFVGPHNEQFWATYRKFVNQAEEILAGGGGGAGAGGVAGGGRTLGGVGASRIPPQHATTTTANTTSGTPFNGTGKRLGSNTEDKNNNNSANNNNEGNKVFVGEGRRLGGDAGAAVRAARTLGSSQYMRHLVLGAVLKRWFEKDEERIRKHQQQLQQQQTKNDDDDDDSNSRNSHVVLTQSQSCGCGEGIPKFHVKKEFDGEQQRQRQQNAADNDDDFSWPCDLCGRIVRGQYCAWCCGNDDEKLEERVNTEDDDGVQRKTKNVVVDDDDDDEVIILEKPPQKQTKKEKKDDDDDVIVLE